MLAMLYCGRFGHTLWRRVTCSTQPLTGKPQAQASLNRLLPSDGVVGHTRPVCRVTSPPLALGDASSPLELFRLIALPMVLPMRESMEGLERLLEPRRDASPSTLVNTSFASFVSSEWAPPSSALYLSSFVMAYSIACVLSPCARKYSNQSTRFFDSATSVFS